ncbi:3-isopropylmalate dehydratase large subunit [Paradesulfitobacterium aromaticivorans]
MGLTITEKIMARASGRETVRPGELVWANVDMAMMQDSGGPRRIANNLEHLGVPVWDPDKVTIVSDHFVPPSNETEARIQSVTRAWVKKHGIHKFHEFEGICHIVPIEKGYVRPGILMVGGDSHSCTGGAMGAMVVALGSTDMLGVLVTGRTWLRVPETIKIIWEGKLPVGTFAKDMVLANLKQLGTAGATYKVLEFSGETVTNLALDERIILTNMSIEMGAKTGIIEPDDTVRAHMKDRDVDFDPVYSDPDAEYGQILINKAEDLEPLVACPHSPDNVTSAGSLQGITIDQAFIGGCTGGKYHDLATAASILKGRSIATGTRLLVAPASQQVLKQALADGVLDILLNAGATLLPSACGPCGGLSMGVLSDGERCISSTNRNFRGRMGSSNSEVYLASAATVAASAVTGQISDPREFIRS